MFKSGSDAATSLRIKSKDKNVHHIWFNLEKTGLLLGGTVISEHDWSGLSASSDVLVTHPQKKATQWSKKIWLFLLYVCNGNAKVLAFFQNWDRETYIIHFKKIEKCFYHSHLLFNQTSTRLSGGVCETLHCCSCGRRLFFRWDLRQLDSDDIRADVQWASGRLCHRLAQFLENVASSFLRPSSRRNTHVKLGKTQLWRTGNDAAFKLRDMTSRRRLPSTITKKKTRRASLTETLIIQIRSLLKFEQSHNYGDLLHVILFKSEAVFKWMWRL